MVEVEVILAVRILRDFQFCHGLQVTLRPDIFQISPNVAYLTRNISRLIVCQAAHIDVDNLSRVHYSAAICEIA